MMRMTALSTLLVMPCLLSAAPRWTPPEGVFPILGWVNPSGEFETQERYTELADAGFTIVHHCSEAAAGFAAKAGMYTLMSLGTPDSSTEEGRAQIDAVVDKWKDDPACLGYSLRDEPTADLFPLLAGITRRAEQKDPKGISFGYHPTIVGAWEKNHINRAHPERLG